MGGKKKRGYILIFEGVADITEGERGKVKGPEGGKHSSFGKFRSKGGKKGGERGGRISVSPASWGGGWPSKVWGNQGELPAGEVCASHSGGEKREGDGDGNREP